MKSCNVLLRRGALVGALLLLTLTASLASSLIVKDSTSIAHAAGGVLNLKTSVLSPLNEALSGQVGCDGNGVQKVSYLDVVPFSVPLLAVLFTCPWYLGRRRTVTDPQG